MSRTSLRILWHSCMQRFDQIEQHGRTSSEEETLPKKHSLFQTLNQDDAHTMVSLQELVRDQAQHCCNPCLCSFSERQTSTIGIPCRICRTGSCWLRMSIRPQGLHAPELWLAAWTDHPVTLRSDWQSLIHISSSLQHIRLGICCNNLEI